MGDFEGRVLHKMIVKMQWPLATTTSIPEILIYNKDKSFWSTVPLENHYKKLFAGKLKIYCKAHVNKNKELVIDKIIPDQAW